MKDFFSALVLIFVAEMGDKTQLLAFALSTQYHYRTVLIGVFLGAFLNHGIAILLANVICKFSSMQYLQMVSAILFIIFGLISLNVKEESNDESGVCYGPKNFGVVMTIATCFFVGELGDKTQLTAMTLALRSIYPIFTLLGSSVGMVLVSLVGILIGKTFSTRINSVYLSIVSSSIFLLFGLGSIIQLYTNGIIGKEIAILIVGSSILMLIYLVYRLYKRKYLGFDKENMMK